MEKQLSLFNEEETYVPMTYDECVKLLLKNIADPIKQYLPQTMNNESFIPTEGGISIWRNRIPRDELVITVLLNNNPNTEADNSIDIKCYFENKLKESEMYWVLLNDDDLDLNNFNVHIIYNNYSYRFVNCPNRDISNEMLMQYSEGKELKTYIINQIKDYFNKRNTLEAKLQRLEKGWISSVNEARKHAEAVFSTPQDIPESRMAEYNAELDEFNSGGIPSSFLELSTSLHNSSLRDICEHFNLTPEEKERIYKQHAK